MDAHKNNGENDENTDKGRDGDEDIHGNDHYMKPGAATTLLRFSQTFPQFQVFAISPCFF